MKPPERFPPDDPREWLNRAKSDLIQAKSRVSGVYLENLCFNAQQAAEKAIKAVLIASNIEFPYVHDLVRLLKMIELAGQSIPKQVWQAEKLTRYAVHTRYPIFEAVPEQHYLEAIETAEAVVRWAEEQL